jgi:hypothetical protein
MGAMGVTGCVPIIGRAVSVPRLDVGRMFYASNVRDTPTVEARMWSSYGPCCGPIITMKQDESPVHLVGRSFWERHLLAGCSRRPKKRAQASSKPSHCLSFFFTLPMHRPPSPAVWTPCAWLCGSIITSLLRPLAACLELVGSWAMSSCPRGHAALSFLNYSFPMNSSLVR